jgi:serine/threonine-protein kinase
MDQKEWKKVNKIVDTALDLKDEDREIYIDKQCGGDNKLKSEVTQLLKSIEDSDAENFLEGSDTYLKNLVADFPESIEKPSSLLGKTIDCYKILELIGHGGMGSVFLAERADKAYNRKIALKVVRRGMDTPSNIARFKQERNILATLSHPNIARLLDGGVTDFGLPYLVMEYVDGTPLLEYCDSRKLTVEQRLSLFKDVCRAVQHAHKNAVIHRDLKASNILVTDDGSVKVLDFGIAKLLESDDPQNDLLQTHTGARMLTLGYAAPEQLESRPVTTATDTYTLGILMYELLTGIHPFNFDDKDLTEVEKLIRHHNPVLPSKKFDSLPQNNQKQIARNRSTTSPKVIKKLQGDLDAIITKALRKEAEERYTSIEQLSEDLNRFKNSRPLIAQSDTIKYRTKKFMRRNRNLVAGVFLTLIISIAFTSYHFNRIKIERNIAETEARKAETVKNFLIDIFRSSNPFSASFEGKDVLARELLLNSKNVIGDELENQPDAYIDIQLAIGDALMGIDAFSEAEENYNKALAKSSEASDPLEKRIEILVKIGKLNVNSVNILTAHEYALEAENLLKQLENPPPVLEASVLSLRGNEISIRDDYKRGNRYYERADSIYINAEIENSYEYVRMLTRYGRSLIYVMDYYKAVSTLMKSNRIHRQLYDNPTTTIAENYKYMGWAYREMGNFEKSNKIFQRSISLKEKLVGEGNFRTALSAYHLSRNYLLAGDYADAEKLGKEVLGIYQNDLPAGSSYILRAKNYVAIAKYHQGKFDEAEQLFNELIETRSNRYGEDHISIANTGAHLAAVYQQTGRHDQAISLFQKCIRINTRELGEDSRGVGVDLFKLAAAYRAKGDFENAEKYFLQSKSIVEEEIPENHYRQAEFSMQFARYFRDKNNDKKAEEYFRKAYDIYVLNFGEDSPRAQNAKSNIEALS